MARYERIEEAEWIKPKVNRFKFGCCDCGLVHILDFRVTAEDIPQSNDYRAEFRAFRDNRATAAVRRERRKRE